MSVDFKDYYQTLGVERTATQADIKKAFQALARRYHPDVTKERDGAADKFAAINEANEVLSDSAKRFKYDTLASEHNEPARLCAQQPRWQAGTSSKTGRPEFHFSGTGFSDFFEQYFTPSFETRHGDTAEGYSSIRKGLDFEGEILITLGEVLRGTVRDVSVKRADPLSGKIEPRSLKVRIPAGAQQARPIRVPGKGSPGSGSGLSGYLYPRIRYGAHPEFQVNGSDLLFELELAPWDTMLGLKAKVPSLESAIKVNIPAST
ncbi:DnaJ domain-containing protein [Pelagicoccus enzymogenes]|uniref:DnaJ domain-containing protein n=1 Tax=Pelagicoccus enzymogenes TaxID=2773457 RepID=UPI00280CF674|nr:DnaJ domain-containing protein [Pelagicoccus enzymogenes]MDQ8198431.1 DnaJ domain-containing protein [Pelagicoccus enzymogenes]